MLLTALLSKTTGEGWTPDCLPDLSGKTYLITGGNSGIGLEAAVILGGRGAHVAILCRNPSKASDALADLKNRAPQGQYQAMALDLSDLASVRQAAAEIRAKFPKIDALINNAGLMALPKREITKDGFEMQLGVNHLGHFALAGLLSDIVIQSDGRFVATASIAHKAGKIHLDDLQSEKSYVPWRAYCQSKLANLMYGLELDRRLRAKNLLAVSVICHPGVSATNLVGTGMGEWMGKISQIPAKLFFQPAYRGAWPTVMAAASNDIAPGGYFGPTQLNDYMGKVGIANMTDRAKDPKVASELWEISEKLTGVTWESLK